MRRDAIDGVVELLPTRFEDERGYLSEIYNQRDLAGQGLEVVFVQENESFSARRGVIRGLHIQAPPYEQGKLIRVVRGAVLDVAVDLRSNSPTFLDHVALQVDATRGNQVWIPPGFAHGFCTLEPATIVAYKVTDYWRPECERRIRFDDPVVGIGWPVGRSDAIVSPADASAPSLTELGDPTALLRPV